MKLGEVIELNKDSLIEIKDDIIYTIAGVQSYGKGILNKRIVKGAELNMKKYKLIKSNQLMWCKVDTKNGGFGITKDIHIGSLASTNMALADINLNKAVPEFIELLFRNKWFYELINSKSKGTTNRKYLKPNDVCELIEIPDLSVVQQKEFVTLYNNISSSGLNDEIVKQTKLLKKLRQSILQEAVQGKLTADWRSRHPELVSGSNDASQLLKRIQEEKTQLIADKKIKKEKALPKITKEDIPYELPEGWVWCRLQDLVNVGTGSTPAKSNSSYYDGTIPWYTSSATNDLFAKESEKLITEKALKETNCKIFPEGTLIIAMYGQGKTRGQISELVIPGATNQAVAAMVFYKTSQDFKGYIKYFFRKIYDEIRLLAEGGAQPNLNVGKIKNTILPLPPLEEQKAIVEKVNALMGLCDSLEQEVQQSQEHSEQLMQSCLREVFEGEISS